MQEDVLLGWHICDIPSAGRGLWDTRTVCLWPHLAINAASFVALTSSSSLPMWLSTCTALTLSHRHQRVFLVPQQPAPKVQPPCSPSATTSTQFFSSTSFLLAPPPAAAASPTTLSPPSSHILLHTCSPSFLLLPSPPPSSVPDAFPQDSSLHIEFLVL